MPAEITALQTYFVGWSVEQAAASVWQPVWLVHAVHVSGVAAESWLWPVAQAVTALSDALVHVVVAPACALATAVHAVQHAGASAETLMSHGEPAHVPVAPASASLEAPSPDCCAVTV